MKLNYLFPITVLLAAVILLFMESCTIYLPQPASIPLMNEKNEVQLNGGFTFLGGANGSVAFAAGEHVALQAYGSVHPDQINYFQGSVGYFTKSNSDLNFEIYAGLGAGDGSDWGFDNTELYNGDYLLYFAQANIGQTNLGSAHIDYGFGLKSGLFDATVADYSISDPIYYTNNSVLIEPQAFIRLGGEKFKIGFQVNGSRIFNLSSKEAAMFYYPVNFSVSMNFRIAPSLRKK